MRHRAVWFAAVPLFALTVLAACGDDKGGSSTTTVATSAPEDVIVSDAAVTKGYGELVELMTTIATHPSRVTEAEIDSVEAKWASFEGTVKQKDPDAYLASEEALDQFNEGATNKDATAMAAGAAKMSTTAATYLAAHPG